MKKILKNVGVLLSIAALLTACTGNTEAKKEKSLSLDEKAKNTFKNTTIIFSGSMMLAFSDVFRGQTEAFAEAFATELDDAAIAEIDEKIGSLNEETLLSLEEVMNNMDEAFDGLETDNLSIYEKMFLADIMKEGVAITEKYDLPNGFRPLSQNLTREELKRYIIRVVSINDNQEDPITKTYMELFEWFQKVGEELNADPEIQEYLRSLRG